MKKILALGLAVLLAAGLTACGGNTPSGGGDNTAPSISGDPKLSGSLYGQDMVKVIVIVTVIAASILASVPVWGPFVLKIAMQLQK